MRGRWSVWHKQNCLAGHPEQFKIFLLAIMAGLRRREIDLLEWSALDFGQRLIRIRATKHYELKSEDSAGDVEIDAEMMQVFASLHRKAKGSFVIESGNPPRPGATYRYYRCESHFERPDGIGFDPKAWTPTSRCIRYEKSSEAYCANGAAFTKQAGHCGTPTSARPARTI